VNPQDIDVLGVPIHEGIDPSYDYERPEDVWDRNLLLGFIPPLTPPLQGEDLKFLFTLQQEQNSRSSSPPLIRGGLGRGYEDVRR
jgi:hypothetical protein